MMINGVGLWVLVLSVFIIFVLFFLYVNIFRQGFILNYIENNFPIKKSVCSFTLSMGMADTVCNYTMFGIDIGIINRSNVVSVSNDNYLYLALPNKTNKTNIYGKNLMDKLGVEYVDSEYLSSLNILDKFKSKKLEGCIEKKDKIILIYSLRGNYKFLLNRLLTNDLRDSAW